MFAVIRQDGAEFPVEGFPLRQRLGMPGKKRGGCLDFYLVELSIAEGGVCFGLFHGAEALRLLHDNPARVLWRSICS